MCSVTKMQTYYVWIITLMANVLIVTSSNVKRPKRDLGFIRNIIGNLFGYNTNNAIMTNGNYIRILYPIPNYRVLMNVMPDPYMNQNINLKLFPNMLVPRTMVMQPIMNFGRPNFPYITAFGDRNSKTAYANLHFSSPYGNMQRVIPVPNHNNIKAPLVRRNDKIPISSRKNITKDKTGEVSRDVSKHEHNLSKFQSIRDTEKISKGINVQRVPSSQSPQSKNPIEPLTTIPQSTVSKIGSIETSSTTPSSTVNLVHTNLSSFYAESTATTAIMQTSTSAPPPSTNVQQLINSQAETIQPTLITSPPAWPLPVENLQKIESFQPMVLLIENKDEENKSTSTATMSTILVEYMQPNNENEINNNFNPHNLSKDIVTVNSNKPNEDTVLQIDNVKYPKDIEGQGDLMVQPSIFNYVIDVINSIAPIKGKVLNPSNIYISQNDDTIEVMGSDDMEVSNQSTDVYPSEREKLDYLNRHPVTLDESSYGSIHEKDYQNKSNESEKGFKWFMPNNSVREMSRGDVPDV